MLVKIVFGWVLMASCVAVHAGGVTSALRWASRHPGGRARFWRRTLLFVRLAAWMILFHLGEITLWALFYWGVGGMPDLASAIYFSGVTYTTTGYGDLVLPNEWRLLGAVEALTGLLMCGWSTAFFFAVVSRLYERKVELGAERSALTARNVPPASRTAGAH